MKCGGCTSGRPTLAGLGAAPFGLTPLQGAAVGLVLCTGLAFVFTSMAEKVLAHGEAPPSGTRRMRANAKRWSGTGNKPFPPPYGYVVVVEDRGDYFGRVISRHTHEVLWETLREPNAFVAKKKADAHLKRLEQTLRGVYPRMLADWEDLQAGRARVTPTGKRLALVPPPSAPKPPRKPRRS